MELCWNKIPEKIVVIEQLQCTDLCTRYEGELWSLERQKNIVDKSPESFCTDCLSSNPGFLTYCVCLDKYISYLCLSFIITIEFIVITQVNVYAYLCICAYKGAWHIVSTIKVLLRIFYQLLKIRAIWKRNQLSEVKADVLSQQA